MSLKWQTAAYLVHVMHLYTVVSLHIITLNYIRELGTRPTTTQISLAIQKSVTYQLSISN